MRRLAQYTLTLLILPGALAALGSDSTEPVLHQEIFAPPQSAGTLDTDALPTEPDLREGDPVLESNAKAPATKKEAADPGKVVIDFQRLVHPLDKVDGGSYTNHSQFVTWVKGENSDQVYPVPPGVTYPWSIDGFADPVNHPGHVYKVIDKLHASYEIIAGKPTIDLTPDDTIGIKPAHRMLQSISGGWKDESWHEQVRARTDLGWDKIFEVSRLNLAARI